MSPQLILNIRFLYFLLLCADACYRFKNRLRSSETKDPTLGPGWAFFNDHGPYLDFVKQYASQEEVHCASLRFQSTHRNN